MLFRTFFIISAFGSFRSNENLALLPYTTHHLRVVPNTKNLVHEGNDDERKQDDAADIQQDQQQTQNDTLSWVLVGMATQTVRKSDEHQNRGDNAQSKRNRSSRRAKGPHLNLYIIQLSQIHFLEEKTAHGEEHGCHSEEHGNSAQLYSSVRNPRQTLRKTEVKVLDILQFTQNRNACVWILGRYGLQPSRDDKGSHDKEKDSSKKSSVLLGWS